MASKVHFDPANVEGLVAAGTTVSAAAERLGAYIELTCGGAGECTSCAVRMIENPFALSEVTDAERHQLGEERITSGDRLACQARIREGDCTVLVYGVKPEPEPESETGGEQESASASGRSRIFEEFEQLPTGEQLTTAIELQLKVAGELLGSIVEVPLKAGEELLTSIFGGRPETAETETKGKEEGQPEKSDDRPDQSNE